MTANDMLKALGKMATYSPDGYLEFTVQVNDVRLRYGNVDYLIVPDSGNGEKWVSDNKVKLWSE